MQARMFHLAVVFGCFAISAPMWAQQGHPLVGSWHGDWGVDKTNRTDLTVVMDWDGKMVTGIVNPGFDQAPVQNAKLNSSNWTVHFEVELKSSSGKTMRCIADGTIDKLHSDRRTLTGAWNCGSIKADFRLTRDRDY